MGRRRPRCLEERAAEAEAEAEAAAPGAAAVAADFLLLLLLFDGKILAISSSSEMFMPEWV